MMPMGPYGYTSGSSDEYRWNVDVEKMLDVMIETHVRLDKGDRVDVYVSDHQSWAAIKDSIDQKSLAPMAGMGDPISCIMGIPVEVFSTKEEAMARCRVLVDSGKRACLLKT